MTSLKALDVVTLCGTLVGVACSRGGDSAADDANRPAVVQLPPPVLPADTARPDTLADHRAHLVQYRREVAERYSVLGAAVVIGDRRQVASRYAIDARLTLAGVGHSGRVQIATALTNLARKTSMTAWDRTSRAFASLGRDFVDSGSYVLEGQRSGGANVIERGTYVSTWQRAVFDDPWVLISDEIIPGTAAKKR